MDTNLIDIYCVNTKQKKSYPMGTNLLEIFEDLQPTLKGRPIVARVNNVTKDLKFKLYTPKRIEFLSNDVPTGMRAYVRSLSFIFCHAVHELFPGVELRIDHPISKGYYCKLMNLDRKVTTDDINAIKQKMRQIIQADYPFVMKILPSEEAINIFEKNGAKDVAKLIRTRGQLYTHVYEMNGEYDWYLGSLAPSTGYIQLFDILPYHDAMFLQIPDRANPVQLEKIIPQEKLFASFNEHNEWNNIMGLCNVGDMNQVISQKGSISSIIKVAEALQEKKIVSIADEICKRDSVRIVLISGPSSSGKTTFSKRLSVQLAVNGVQPIPLSMDNYFVSRDKTPRDANGDYDFESLYAVDLDLFNLQLNQLLNGEEVEIPYFNFETGQREYRGEKMCLGEKGMLVIEGIHALNPSLTPEIPAETKFKVYVSALTTISLDNHNWIPTTDNRLLRRIIRDFKYRGYSAVDTISRWPKVMEGENKWIFPYQENADMMFNSALIFELSVLKKFAEPILSEVPQCADEYTEAYRLQKFLNYFSPIQETEIPFTSLLREFLGGSTFNY